jgi:hypothetical protein
MEILIRQPKYEFSKDLSFQANQSHFRYSERVWSSKYVMVSFHWNTQPKTILKSKEIFFHSYNNYENSEYLKLLVILQSANSAEKI